MNYNFIELLKTGELPPRDPNFYSSIMTDFSSVQLLKVNGLISSERTLKNIENEQIKAALKYLNKITPSSVGYSGARYCSLVPIFMSAHKEFNGIGYSEWDKTDPYLKYTMGEKLFNSISSYTYFRKGIDDNIQELRKLAAVYSRKDGTQKIVPLDKWPNHTITFILNDKKIKWPAASPVRHIKLQTWYAHVSKRNEFMLLDTINWDSIPTALDAVIPEVEELDF